MLKKATLPLADGSGQSQAVPAVLEHTGFSQVVILPASMISWSLAGNFNTTFIQQFPSSLCFLNVH